MTPAVVARQELEMRVHNVRHHPANADSCILPSIKEWFTSFYNRSKVQRLCCNYRQRYMSCRKHLYSEFGIYPISTFGL